MKFFFMSVLFHSLCPLKSKSKTLLFQVMTRLHGWDHVPTDAKLRGGMPPKAKGLSEEEIAAKATVSHCESVTPKGKEQEKADLGTPKEKRDRESPSTSLFKSPVAKKKIVLDNTMVEGAEVRFSTDITSS